MNPDPQTRTETVKAKAIELGFDDCGIARAGNVDPEDRLGKWLDKGYHADMAWLANSKEIRQDVRLKLPAARSVVVVTKNYWNPRPPEKPGTGRIARYAWGRDYHRVLRPPLRKLAEFIGSLDQNAAQYSAIDSGPILERAWAAKAGLGWIGKNSLLLRKQGGSWSFLAVILTTVDLVPDAPAPEHCGSCTACIDSCPTNAIVDTGIVDARRCISYHTIENRAEIPPEIAPRMDDWIFGCDICQEVCPWSRFATPSNQTDFKPRDKHAHPQLNDLLNMNEESFRLQFEGSPILRAKYPGMMRNARIARQNAPHKPNPTPHPPTVGPEDGTEPLSESR